VRDYGYHWLDHQIEIDWEGPETVAGPPCFTTHCATMDLIQGYDSDSSNDDCKLPAKRNRQHDEALDQDHQSKKTRLTEPLWNCYACLRLSLSQSFLCCVEDLTDFLMGNLPNWTCFDEHSLHISVSTSIPLRQLQMQTFMNKIEDMVKSVHSFPISFQGGLRLLSNQDNTKTFLVIGCSKGSPQITQLIQNINDLAKSFNIDDTLDDPYPHMSILWKLGDAAEVSQEKLEDLWKQFNKKNSRLSRQEIKAIGLEYRVGNKTYELDFKEKHST
jgi:hypothetical protein